MDKIDQFIGKYYFLSNFHGSLVTIEDMVFNNAEAAFQSFKDESQRKKFQLLNPSAAKKLGRSVDLREDWDEVKDHIMYKVVLAKFSQNRDLMEKLLETGETELEEGNTWGDTYWGVFKGNGQNMLGRILMLVRSHLRNQKKLSKLALEQIDDKQYEVIMEILTQPGTGEYKKP